MRFLKDSVTQHWLEVNSNHWLKCEIFYLNGNGSEKLSAERQEGKSWLKVKKTTVV